MYQSKLFHLKHYSVRFSTLSAASISEEWFCPKPQDYWSMMAYNDSKLCNILIAAELAQKWASRGIAVFSLHPGNLVSSNLSRNWCPYRLLFTLVRPFTKSLVSFVVHFIGYQICRKNKRNMKKFKI